MQRRANGQAYLEMSCAGKESNHENVGLMSFIIQACKQLPDKGSVLDLASGPTIYQIFPAARHASTIVVSDSSPTLLSFAEEWRDCDDGAFNWDPFIKKALQLEADQGIATEDDVMKRKEKTRKAIEFAVLDITKEQTITVGQSFDLVQCAFLGSSCDSQKSLLEIWKKSASYVKLGGHMIIVEGCDAADASEGAEEDTAFVDHEKRIGDLGWDVIEKKLLRVQGEHGYSGFAMFHLRKPEAHKRQ